VRVLILHSQYLSGPVSGENQVVKDEARLLSEAGHEVRVWAPIPRVEGPVDRLRAAGAAVWSAAAARRVGDVVRRDEIDVVHVHNVFPTLSPAVLRSAARAGAAVVMTLHNYRLMCLPGDLLRDGAICEACVGHVPWRGARYRCYRGSASGSAVMASSLSLHRLAGTYDDVTLFLAISAFVRDKHVEGGWPAERIVLKPNFSWPAPRRLGAGTYSLFVGRLTREKGADTLVRAWRAADAPGRLVVVGDGGDGPAIRAMAGPGVEFRGTVPNEQIAGLIAEARGVYVPSRCFEGASKVAIEAYRAGVPVVASRIGALPETVVDGVSGILVDPEDTEGWAGAARRLADDAECVRLGGGGLRLWEERYSPEVALPLLEDAYHEAIARRRP
jgi:glycosyltransferase involved in cell wall biosynthesis